MPPPSRRPPQLLDRPEAWPVRRALGILAAVLAVDGLVVWLLSFVPSAPLAGSWQALVLPAFVLMFVPFGAMVLNQAINQQGRSPLRGTFGVHGWRRVLIVVVFVGVWLTGISVFFSGGLKGQPEAINGRYYSNDHGTVTEISEEEWRTSSALVSRLFAVGVLAFGTIAAVMLLRRPDDVDPTEASSIERLATSHEHQTVAFADLRGHGHVVADASGSVDEVVARLRSRFPIRTSAADDGATRVVADWDVGRMGLGTRNTFPMLLDGELRAVGSSTRVDLSLRPATRAAELMPLGLPWAFVLIAVAVGTTGRAAASSGPIFLVFIAAWCGFAIFIGVNNATAPRKAARLVEAQIAEALAAPPPSGSAPGPPPTV